MDPNGAYWVAQVKNLVDLLNGWAWQIVVLILIATFRGQIAPLLGRLRTFKGWGAEGTFDPSVAEPAVEKAEAQAAGQARATIARPSPPEWRLPDELMDLADHVPTAAVIEAYAAVEGALRQRMADADVPPVYRQRTGWPLIRNALQRRLISTETAEAIRRLLSLRNRAAHGQPANVASAVEYINLCNGVIFAIQTWRPEE